MHTATLFCAQYLFLIPMALLAWGWFQSNRSDRRTLLIRSIIALILGIALAKAGGALYDDPRPFVAGHYPPMIAHAPDNGFPSDHSLLVFSCAFLLWPFDRRMAICSVVLACFVGAGRVLSGLHHPIDVLASIVFAWISSAVGTAAIKGSSLKSSGLIFQKGDTD